MKHRIAFLVVAVLLIAVIIIYPGSRKIEKTIEATEYSFTDPDYAAIHIITVKGYDTRNLLGQGHYEGAFAIEDWEVAQEGWKLSARFPVPDTLLNASAVHPSGYHISTDIMCLLPNRDWTSFVAIVQTVEDIGDHRHCSFCPATDGFIVSGTLTREEALAVAYRISKGTALEPLFATP